MSGTMKNSVTEYFNTCRVYLSGQISQMDGFANVVDNLAAKQLQAANERDKQKAKVHGSRTVRYIFCLSSSL